MNRSMKRKCVFLLVLTSTTLVTLFWKSSYLVPLPTNFAADWQQQQRQQQHSSSNSDSSSNNNDRNSCDRARFISEIARIFLQESPKATFEGPWKNEHVTNFSKAEVVRDLQAQLVIPDDVRLSVLSPTCNELTSVVNGGMSSSSPPSSSLSSSSASTDNFKKEEKHLKKRKKKTKHNVVFLKVHKAASTTVQNIMMRFAFWNQLNVVLHQKQQHLNEHYLGLPKRQLVKLPKGEKFNILCHHVIYDGAAIRSIVPNDTVHVGIVREPFDRFLSAFKYYSSTWGDMRIINSLRHSSSPLGECINRTDVCEPTRSLTWSQLYYRLIRDFGYPLTMLSDKEKAIPDEAINKFISKTKSDFDFVMVMEKFDESLIYLRRLLGWSFKDVLYLQLNNQKKDESDKVRNKFQVMMSEYMRREDMGEMRRLFSDKSEAEVKFYNAFLELFQEKLNQQDIEFVEELLHFRQVKKKAEEFCLANAPPQSSLTISASKWSDSFRLSPMDCFLMNLEEVSFSNLMRKVQEFRFSINNV